MDVNQGRSQLEQLFARLDHDQRTLKHNPTIDAIARGTLNQAQLCHWATQLYIGNKGHNANILGLIYAKCDDFRARRAIVENLEEEELGKQSGVGRSHMQLYLEFGEALGIPREAMLQARMSPDATAMVHWMYWLADSKPWYTTLAGISLGSELHNPDAYVRVIDGLKQHYGLDDDGVRFFSVHVEVDKDHGDSSAFSIFRAIPEGAAAEALWAVETHIEFMYRLWADVDPAGGKRH
jgi:pyrroloquinoline quinone (PQQ) biosynthesis protein C